MSRQGRIVVRLKYPRPLKPWQGILGIIAVFIGGFFTMVYVGGLLGAVAGFALIGVWSGVIIHLMDS